MIFVNSLLFLVLFECALVSVVCLGVMGYRLKRKQRKQTQEADLLVPHFRDALLGRREALTEKLSPGLLDYPQSVVEVDELLAREAAFYRLLLTLLMDSDVRAWQQLEAGVRSLLEPYETSIVTLTRHSGELGNRAALVDCLRQDLERAQADVDTLATRLHASRVTLSRVSAEYADLFARHAGAAELEISRQRMLECFDRCLERRSSFVERE